MKSPADLAEEEFDRIHRDKQKPSNIEEQELKIINWKLPELLVTLRLASSKSDARRLIQQNGVKIDDIVYSNWEENIEVKNRMIVQVGKRRFKKIILQANKKNMNEENTSPSPIIEGESEVKEEMSPTPPKIKEMDFPDALKEVIAGKKITKLEWCNKEVYGVLEDGFLMLWKDDGKKYQWIISEADLKGEDFVVIK